MKRTFSRMTALVSGTVMMLIYGLIYAWSIYSGPFSEQFGWASAALGVCFTIMLAAFCIGGVLGGVLTTKKGIGPSILLGGAMSCLGFCLCALLDAGALWLLYLSFFIAGLGDGMVYNTILSAVVCRFPDKKGTASGAMLMGFGASSLIIGSAAYALITSPLGWRMTYILTGALLFAAAFIGRIFLRAPELSDDETEFAPQEGMTTSEMVKTSSFWLFFLISMIGCAFGSGIIGHARYIALEAGAAASLATLTVGLISVTNGLGRILFGLLHDRSGFRASLYCDALILIISGVIAVFALHSRQTLPTLLAMMFCGLAYGGIPTISSAIASEFYGRAWYGKNFSVMNLRILPAAFASAIAGAMQTAAGTYVGAFILFTGLEVVAVVLIAVLGRIRAKN